MVWPSKTLAVVVFILQVYPSRSCTFTQLCPLKLTNFTGIAEYTNKSTLYDCLKTCYSHESCGYAVFFGQCWALTTASFEGTNLKDCNYYRLERDSIADPEQCKPVSNLLWTATTTESNEIP
ncbi:hypothetical protein V3C99_008207 [Haemonchus contortus]|uniref:Apple domain-containing protein n=1 Tax=Haemonchus contortus TaxID=6289 RepID=A0A7I4YM16_HAECO